MTNDPLALALTRRQLFGRTATGIGVAALASLLEPKLFAAAGLPGLPHFAPKAKRVIFLHQSGAPSQMDLFDYKPGLAKLRATELPASVRMGQRITGMTSGQSSLPVASNFCTKASAAPAEVWSSKAPLVSPTTKTPVESAATP